MNENVDLTKILKDCPKGWKFWSPIFGEVEFERNYGDKGSIHISINKNGTEWYFTSDAKIILGNGKSQEIMIYPSREQHDWSKFNAPWYKKGKFDPNTLKPFDKVLVKDYYEEEWIAGIFARYFKNRKFPYVDICLNSYTYCIPYNDDTKHLVNTTEEAPEYYRYWED